MKLIFVLLCVSATSCASNPRVLSVKSYPAEAEVCIKGKSGTGVFRQEKTCIGTTPLEVDSVTLTDQSGKKRQVRFSQIDSEKEPFYLVVSRAGYAPQSMTVPAWDHFVTLRQEQTEAPAQAPLVAVATKGQAKISSDPVGALVYVNDFLRGNTPYLLEAESGQTLRIKIEQSGYRPIERSITVDNGKAMEINLTMEKEVSKIVVVREETRELASTQNPK